MTEQQDSSSSHEAAIPPSPSTRSEEGLSGPGPAQPQPVASPAPGAPGAPRTPGGNQLDAIDEADADEVVPKDPKETQLRDTISPAGAGRDSVDDEGSPPRPL